MNELAPLPDDGFLQEIVNRWRAQTFNPTSADYSLDPNAQQPAPVPGTPGPQPVAAPGMMQQQPLQQPTAVAPTLRRTPPPGVVPNPLQRTAAPPPPPAAPQPSAAQQGGQQQSLASLIRQFRG